MDLGALPLPGCVLEFEAPGGARLTVRVSRPECVNLSALAAELWGTGR